MVKVGMTGSVVTMCVLGGGIVFAQLPDPLSTGGKLAQMGVTGILAVGIVVLLYHVRALNKELSEQRELERAANTNRDAKLVGLIVENTAVTSTSNSVLGDLKEAVDRNSGVIENLRLDVASHYGGSRN